MRKAFHNRLILAGGVLLSLAAAVLLSGCGHPPLNAERRESTAKASNVPRARDADDTARFLAGLPGTPESPFAELESSEAWQTHRQRVDEAWRKAETDLIAGLGTFQKQELSHDPAWAAPVFYPFGGPDAL